MAIRQTHLVWSMTIFLILSLGLTSAARAGSEAAVPVGENSSPSERKADDSPSYDDYARFLAGRGNLGGCLAAYEKKPAWIKYSESMNRNWESFEARQLKPMREWASRELGNAGTDTVFYPFSGPDFVNVYTMFPRAKTYLLVALEPPGVIPDSSVICDRDYLASLQRSLWDYLQIDFFGTNRMDAQIAKTKLKGVLPVLLFFLSREDVRVLDVRYWVMKPDGAVEEQPANCEAELSPGISGLRLVFEGAGGAGEQTLYYFRLNLQNRSFSCQQQFVSFLKGFGPLTTFTKAASYLLYSPNFSDLRQIILDRSQYVVQGDSGIPLKYFDRASWNLRFYGTYKGPLALFRNKRQADLAEAYKNGKELYPLPFGFGYHHRAGTGNLLLAAKKSGENLK